MGTVMNKNRRPQRPKQRNPVKKNMDKFQRPQTHRDRTQYNRYEDYLKDQLDDMVDNLKDNESKQRRKEEFKAKLAGKEYDPDGHKNYQDWLDAEFDSGYYNSYEA